MNKRSELKLQPPPIKVHPSVSSHTLFCPEEVGWWYSCEVVQRPRWMTSFLPRSVWHAASYMAVCCSTQRTLEISWPCPSHRGLGRTLCCENIALGTSPQSSETKMSMPRHMEWLHPVSSHWSTSGLWEGPLGVGGVKRGSIRLTNKAFWLQIAALNAC